MAILELSKLHMYRLYYDCFKKYYKDNIKLLYQDTDSLVLKINTPDFYLDMQNKLPDIFDFSTYPTSHFLYNTGNEMKVGYLKDETKSIPIHSFCGVKPKMYSFVFGDQCKKTGKGVKQSVLKDFNHEAYVNVIKNDEMLRNTQYHILSKNHDVSTCAVNKISLTSFYDKCYMINNNFSIPYGHYQLKQEIEDDDL